MPSVDLTKFSPKDLKELSRSIEKEIKRRESADKKKVLTQMKELAASVGMTVEEILEANPQKKSKGQPKYRNPDNPEQTWTGRGKRPGWLNDALNSGIALEEMEIR